MEHTQAARILEIMAQMEPGYGDFAAKYGPMLADVEVPDDFADMTLELLRDDPERAAQIAQYERNLSRMQSFGLGGVSAVALAIAVTILLLHSNVDIDINWNLKVLYGKFKIKSDPVSEQTLTKMANVLNAASNKDTGKTTDAASPMNKPKKGR